MGRTGSVLRKELGSPNWVTGAVYAVDDLVLKDGYLVRCLTAHTAGTWATDVSSGYWQMASPMRNHIINGNFDIWQRGAGPFSGVYSSDRWLVNAGVEAATQAVSGLPNSTYAMQLVRTTASVATFYATYRNEAVVTKELESKVVTLSGWLKQTSGTAAPLYYSVYSPNTTDTFSSVTIEITPAQLLTSIDSTWRKFAVTFSMPSNCSTKGFQLNIGSASMTGPVTYQLAQVMLNEGPAPAQFQTAGANIAEELAMCQRYFEKSYALNVKPGTANTSGICQARAIITSTPTYGSEFNPVRFATAKRTEIPTITRYSPISGAINNIYLDSPAQDNGTNVVYNPGSTGFVMGTTANILNHGGVMSMHWTADAEL